MGNVACCDSDPSASRAEINPGYISKKD